MKKLFSLISGMMVCAVSIMGSACANPLESDVARELEIKDQAIREFVEECVLAHEGQFVYDMDKNYRLSDEFDSKHGIYTQTFPEVKVAHDEEINRLLSNGQEVMYNGRLLSDWVFCELRVRGVNCEEMIVACREGPSLHTAVLIPQEVDGSKQWYVCDLSTMCKLKTLGEGAYKKFLFYPLKEYISLYGDGFRGAVVSDGEYTGYIDGKGVVGGRDIFCWLSQEGHSASTAMDMLVSRPTSGLRFMASFDHYDKDLQLFMFFRDLEHLDDFPVQEILLC